MCTGNDIYTEDLEYISSLPCITWEKLRGKTILVTGGTGLIGSAIINSLLYANSKMNLHLSILALVRDLTKAKKIFQRQSVVDSTLKFITGNVENLPVFDCHIDYIIHGASPTASQYFIDHPVETIEIAVVGTKKLLELAKEKIVDGVIFLSSMEVYGAPLTDAVISESAGCTLDSMAVRSCYPVAKRLCENLCASYASEYGVPAKVIRLAQTFGPGVKLEDNRVFAEFARDVLNRKDIVLQTTGTSKRVYLYTADAVSAILTALMSGVPGEAYNAANPETYCSIVEMAQMVAHEIGDDSIRVHVPSNNIEANSKFPPPHHLNLGVDKLRSLGWVPQIGLKEMYLRMMAGMKLI